MAIADVVNAGGDACRCGTLLGQVAQQQLLRELTQAAAAFGTATASADPQGETAAQQQIQLLTNCIEASGYHWQQDGYMHLAGHDVVSSVAECLTDP